MRASSSHRFPRAIPAEARSPPLSPLPLRRPHLRASLPLELVRHFTAHPVLRRDDHPRLLRPASLPARLSLLQISEERRQGAALSLRTASACYHPTAHF